MNMNMGKTAARGVFWNTTTNVAEKFIILANVYIALVFLTVHEYGLVQLVLSVISLTGIVLLPGLANAITADLSVEHGRKDLGRMKEILLRYGGLIFLLSIVTWCVVFFGSNVIVHFSGGQLAGYYIKIASFTLLISPFRIIWTMLLTTSLRFREQSLYSMVEEVAKLCVQVVLVVWLRRGPEGLLIATVVSQLIALVVFAPTIQKLMKPILQAPWVAAGPFWSTLSRHRVWSIANSYMGTLASNIQVWVIKLFLGTDAVAIYSVAQGLVAQIVTFLPLSTVVIPILPRYVDDPPGFKRVLRTSMKAQLVVALVLMVAGVVGGPIMVLFFFTKYIPALPLYFILLLGIIPNASNSILTPVFMTLKRQHSYFYSSTIKALLTASVFFLCVYYWGLLGAAIGSVIAGLLSAIERQIRLSIIEPAYTLSYARFFSVDAEERSFARVLFADFKKRWLKIFT